MSAKPWDSAAAARDFDLAATTHIESFVLPSPDVLCSEIRHYLQRMTDRDRTRNRARLVSIHESGNGDTQIDAGPTIFKEPCETCIQFRSGAQLSFGVTLRNDGDRTTLVAYRFYLHLLPASGLKFVRIDLNPHKDTYDPLHMPRSHMHPGFEGVHIPFPPMRPLEVLDRIVHVIEPHFVP